jgi:hypothetical protein
MNPEGPRDKKTERWQSPETVKQLLREAFEAGRMITVDIEPIDGGEAVPTQNLGIMDMDETQVELAVVEEDGGPGASGWVELTRVKGVRPQ